MPGLDGKGQTSLATTEGRRGESPQPSSCFGNAQCASLVRSAPCTVSSGGDAARRFPLAILDLDQFKAINDTHGHPTGDAVLSAFCAHVSQRMRPSHMLGRLGGEEFLLLMPGTSLADAEVVMERVRRTLQPHTGLTYTFSAGLAQAGAGEPLPAVIERGRQCALRSQANRP